MIISDLEHLEVVREENRIEGGVQIVSGASSAGSGLATTGRVFSSESSFSSASEQPSVIFGRFGIPIVVGVIDQTSASASASGSTSPFFFWSQLRNKQIQIFAGDNLTNFKEVIRWLSVI